MYTEGMNVSETVFACHEKACAPPPAGRGGSLPSRGKGYIVTARYDYDGNRIDNQPERTPMGHLKYSPHAPVRQAKLNQDGTTNTANPGGLGGGSAGRKVKVTAEKVVDAAKYGVSPHTGKPYSAKNPPPGAGLGAKKTTWKELEDADRAYRRKYILSEHD